MKKLKNTLYNKIDFSITSIFTITILLLTGCMNDMAIEKAKNNSEYILNNLSKEDILEMFPIKNFPKFQINQFLNGILDCGYNPNQGKFIDYIYKSGVGSKDKVALIYHYRLNCDSIRLILNYNIQDNPELVSIEIYSLNETVRE